MLDSITEIFRRPVGVWYKSACVIVCKKVVLAVKDQYRNA